jgi:hypothetical protein
MEVGTIFHTFIFLTEFHRHQEGILAAAAAAEVVSGSMTDPNNT